MLLAVDFYFQVDFSCAYVGRLYAKYESVVVFLLLNDGFAQPGEGFAKMVYRFLDGFSVYLYQVDVSDSLSKLVINNAMRIWPSYARRKGRKLS